MKFLCLIGRHQPGPEVVRNQGFTFGRCGGCECDLVRSMGRWQTVPKGFRVVWRGAEAATQAPRTLPVPQADAGVRDTTLSRIGMFGALAGAGLRAFAWSVGDRLDSWSGRIRFQRRPALLRLPAP